MHEAKAIVQLPPLDGSNAGDEVAHAFTKLLANAAERAELGSRAKQLVTDNQGSADRTINLLTPIFAHTS
jgi:3-deoxy-D-manno-octulosonic-acid transferase